MKRFGLVLLVLLLTANVGWSQEPPTWWQVIHNYNPSKSWYEYMTYSTSYFGPNALPVPEVYDGRVPLKSFAEISTDAFWGFGDQTQSLSMRLGWTPLPGRVSFSVWGVLGEHYRTTISVRDARASQIESGRGQLLIGDFYLSSLVNLFDEKAFRPNLNLEVVLKTASSKSPADARFMDTPGYWFNLTTGKSLFLRGSWVDELRFVGNLGFLCYQLNAFHQNDAPLYGGKVLVTAGKLTWDAGIHGYSGWVQNGDKPLVLRYGFQYDLGNRSFFMHFQHALRDYPFRRLQVGFKYDFDFSSPKTKRMKTVKFLSAEEQDVLLKKGTEKPFTGEFVDFDKSGTYTCKQCGSPLYQSADKFHSGCGWPSFDDEIPGAVKRIPDADGKRTEIVCANCNGHLGHVFKGEGFTSKDTRHCVNSISLDFVAFDVATLNRFETAIFAGGCFWGVEHLLQQAPGVSSVVSGYIGGETERPTYQQVSNHSTGHAEAVKVVFDPKLTSYETLAKLFFEIHDPTQLDRQGPDVGDQYRSEIFYTNPKQKEVAEMLIGLLKAKGYKVVTQVTPARTFWEAEAYHQDYYVRKGTEPYCHMYTKRF
jgi:peptide methionine sulfoxide reductase msrA/msrB